MTHIWTSPRHDNRPSDTTRCCASVWKQDGNRGRLYQCQRKPICTRVVDGAEYGFCKQHDPEAVNARNKARQEQWRLESAARDQEHERQKQTRVAMDACKAAIEKIAGGYNDARTLAEETLRLFP